MVMLMSSAYQRSSYDMYVSFSCSAWYVDLYPQLPMKIHPSRGSMEIANRNGENVSLCKASSMYEYDGIFPVWSHVACTWHLVEMFTHVYITFREA
jgi:hypothetical protein